VGAVIPDRLAVALADRYRIEGELGAGGMATVYLAEDLKHDRKVAIKVLRPELAAVLGAERFVQEIKTTAQLQHPHILPLHDSGTADGFLFYVMPYIEGETLRDKLNRETQLGVDEAVRVAREVADALDYAHRQGVIHRDIKPENILLHDGRPMVADFGIALAVSAAAGGRMTETGTSIGTPHYMAPEQATGDKQITGRADVYSLASVLYEMLAGEPPHTGGSAQAVIMKIIAEPVRPVGALRTSVPPNVAAALGKALEKLPADRFGSAKEFSDALDDPSFQVAVGGASAAASPDAVRALDRRTMMVAAAALVVGWFGHALLVRDRGSRELVARVSIPLDSGLAFTGPAANAGRPIHTRLALSPDGRTLVYSAEGGDGTTRLFARALEASSATPIEGTEGAEAPIFSPRGDEIAFWANDHLWRLPLAGGTPVDVATIDGFGGASWGDDDHIVFRDRQRRGLARVPASGGAAVEPLPSHPGASLPHVLPGSRAVLYTVDYGASLEERRVEALSLRDGRVDTIVDNASDARYVTTGHLLFARVGTLMAVSFDPTRVEVTASATGVLPDLMHAMNGWNTRTWTDAAQYAVSAVGHLAYLAGGVTPAQQNQVVWLDRNGQVTDLGLEPNGYLVVRVDPTGDRLAVATPVGDGGIWTVDLRRSNAVRRIASGHIPGLLWSRDGRDVYYDYLDDGGIYRVPADGSSRVERVGAAAWAADPTPDGLELIVVDQSADVQRLSAMTLSAGETRVLVDEPAGVSHPALSPDGRWLAYAVSDGSEVVVRSWPDLEHRTAIAGPRVSSPAWARGGQELFYQQAQTGSTGELVLTLVARSFDSVTGRPIGDPTNIPLPWNYRSMSPVRAYDVTADGQRIAAILTNTDLPPPPRRIEITLNWASTLERRDD